MEGFGSIKDVASYDVLAKYYDELLQDEESLSLWLKYIEETDFETVLELASGSGVMASILASKGYDVIASDLSSSMKDVSRNNFDGEYHIINMIEFDLGKTFDLVLCICDSINYLVEDELDSMFKSVYKHLNNGGRFIFDMHSLKRLDEFVEEYIEEGSLEDAFYQWSIVSDKIDNSLNERFVFFFDDELVQEHHTQHVFRPEVVIKKLEDVGFKVRRIEDFVEDEKELYIGEKL